MPKFGKINLNRRVVDHRVFADRGLIVNQTPFTKDYFWAIRQRFFNTFISGYPVYGGVMVCGLLGALYLGYMYTVSTQSEFGVLSIVNQDFRHISWTRQYLSDHLDTPYWDKTTQSIKKN
jgi:hypothetical protein